MKEFVEKLNEKLTYLLNNFGEHCEEWGSDKEGDCHRKSCSDCVLTHAIEIVNQLAEEYNNGWIPCSERLPDKSGWFLCTQEYHSLTNRKLIKVTTELVEFYDNKWRRAKNLVVTHWQPLPEPYQPKGE